MSVFTPFAFIKSETAIVPVAWTPADLPGVEMWFKASDNVTLSGTDVLTWTDKINSYVLNSSYWGGITKITQNSAWVGGNNQAFMEFGLSGTAQGLASVFTTTLTSTDDVSVISIIAPLNPTTSVNSYVMNSGLTTNGVNGFEMMHTTKNPTSGDNVWGSYNYQGGGVGAKSTGVTTVNSQVTVFATVFDDSTNTLVAYVDSTSAISNGSGAGSNRTKTSLKVGIGDYDGTGAFFGQARLAELIVTKNTLTTGDVQNLLDYRDSLYI